jgi:hypothetical protein
MAVYELLLLGRGGHQRYIVRCFVSLRKSPTRTPAFVAANRANARKSTGPRTLEGKRSVALNALRRSRSARKLLSFLVEADKAWTAGLQGLSGLTGWAARVGLAGSLLHGFESGPYTAFFNQAGRERQELLSLYRALYAAFLPDPQDEAQVRYVRRRAVAIWLVKRRTERAVESRTWRRANLTPGGALPGTWRMRAQRTEEPGGPGWWVTVSVWVRRGRGRRSDPPAYLGYGWQEGGARLHAGVTVTASMRHPALGCENVWEVPPGVARRVVLKAKPECSRKDVRFSCVIPDCGSVLEARAEAERAAEQLWSKEMVRFNERRAREARAKGFLLGETGRGGPAGAFDTLREGLLP